MTFISTAGRSCDYHVLVDLMWRLPMNENRAEVLERLKAELAFLESGGYRRSAHWPWRAGYIFEESPSCPNFNDKPRFHRCVDCWLMEFVEPERRTDETPCRFVQLT